MAVGDEAQRYLDADERMVVADWLGISVGEISDVEAGYRLVSLGDEQNEAINVRNSGDVTLTFVEVSGLFKGYQWYEPLIPVRLFGRVCPDGEDCDGALFRNLSDEFVVTGEDVSRGNDRDAPFMRFALSVPAGHSMRIELMAHYRPGPDRRDEPKTGIAIERIPAGILFHGIVTIDGEQPTISGLRITARIGDEWESYSVRVKSGSDEPASYGDLFVRPDEVWGLCGSKIEFWLDGEIPATLTSWYAVFNEFTEEVYPDCSWIFPMLRLVDLDFPRLP